MPQNDFLPVAIAVTAEVDTQAEFAGSGYQVNGFTAGIADPASCNKAWRQGTVIGNMIGDFINSAGLDALDNADIATLLANFIAAIRSVANSATSPKAQVVPYAANLNFDCSAGNNNVNPLLPVFEVFLTGNVTSWQFSGVRAGQLITLVVNQQGGPFTWPAPSGTVLGAGSIAPVVSSTSIQQFAVMASGSVRAVTGVVVS